MPNEDESALKLKTRFPSTTLIVMPSKSNHKVRVFNPFALANFAEKRILGRFSSHYLAIKSES